MSKLSGPFQNAWRDLRFRRRLFWGLFAGYLPFGAALAALVTQAGYTPDGKLAVFLVPYMALWAGSGMWMSFFKCPRCNSMFFRRAGMGLFVYHNPYASACLSCNLPIYSKTDPGDRPRPILVPNHRPRTAKLFGIFAMPLFAMNIVVGACLLMWSADSFVLNPVPNQMIVWFTLTNGLSTFLSFMTLNSIRNPQIHTEMSRLNRGNLKLLFSGTLMAASLSGLVALLSFDLSDPNLVGTVFRHPTGIVIVLASLILSSTLVFFTRDVCARLLPK